MDAQNTQQPNNIPSQLAQLTLRPDLTLQLAVGEVAHDVDLDLQSAYGLAAALLTNIENLTPWAGRADAELVHRAHDLAFASLKFAKGCLQIKGEVFSEEELGPQLALDALNRALAVVALLDPNRKDDAESTPH